MKLFFDMDGVLSDFQSHFKKHYPQYDNLWDLSDEVFWPLVKAIDNFWEDLPLMPHAEELFKFANENFEVEILSSPSSHDHRSYGAKIEWLEKHFSAYDFPINLVTQKYKKLFAEKGALLIDDQEQNCVEFKENGGQTIHFQDGLTTLNALKALV